jgi:hypothetical protein
LTENRLGLARWLIDPFEPLLARVTVNRFWQMLFGLGLVRTVEDFGSRKAVASEPTAARLAGRQFMESGWNVRAFSGPS